MIKIAHAYGNLLNLYGSYVNPVMLARYLTEAGYDTSVGSFSIGSYIDISSCDLIYFGAGTERRMLSALLDFRRFQPEFSQYLAKGGRILASGNSIAILGKTITDVSGRIYQGLSCIDIETTIKAKREYSELIMTTPLSEQPVIGSINSSLSISAGDETGMFRVIKDSSGRRRQEGVVKDGIYATESGGPLLIRNPYLLHRFSEITAGSELPLNTSSWFSYAVEGYKNALAALKRDLG